MGPAQGLVDEHNFVGVTSEEDPIEAFQIAMRDMPERVAGSYAGNWVTV